MEAFDEEYTSEIPTVSEPTLRLFTTLGIDDYHATSIKLSEQDWFPPFPTTSLPTTVTLKLFQDHTTRNNMEHQQPILKLKLYLLLVVTRISIKTTNLKAPQSDHIHINEKR